MAPANGDTDGGGHEHDGEHHDHEHGHDHGHDHDDGHHAHDVASVGVALVTISSTRSLSEDDAGDAAQTAVEAADHEVVERELVTDDVAAIRATVTALVDQPDVDLVVTLGGTGITPDDVTVEALAPLFDAELPGFGERFRARSVDEIGPRAIASRATAGVIDGVPTFAAPGSTGAAELATEELIAPVAGHLVGLAGRSA